MSLIFSDREISPERRLFVAIIANAAREATGVVREPYGPRRERVRLAARRWFEHPTDDFRLICESAGYSPRDVRKWVLDYIKRVEADPASTARKATGPAPGKRSCKPTLADVARLAGVSVATAGSAIRNPGYVADATRARVQAAIKELGYVSPPNAYRQRKVSGNEH